MKAYNPHEIEPRWQKAWDESGLNTVREDESKPKKYVLEMFPYLRATSTWGTCATTRSAT